jgi:hypothetical protein
MNMTRLTFSLLITLLLATFVTAQESGDKSDPSDLTVLKHSWHKEFVRLRADSNPLQPNEDLIRQTRAEKQVIQDRDYRLPNQTTEIPMPVPEPRPTRATRTKEFPHPLSTLTIKELKNNVRSTTNYLRSHRRYLARDLITSPKTSGFVGSRSRCG